MRIFTKKDMTREEKCKLAIDKGYYYDALSGKVFGPKKKEIIKKSNGYIDIMIFFNKKQYHLYGHHFAWYLINKEVIFQIDHINGIRNDNRIVNLRSVTDLQNKWNYKNTKGYYKDKHKKYVAEIWVNYKKIYLGYFKTEEEASDCYKNAKLKHHLIK